MATITYNGPFPNPIRRYNIYICGAIPYLNTHKARLKVPAAKAAKLLTLLDDWKIVFPQSVNRAKRTTVVTQNKNNLRKKITALLREVYRDIPATALATKDRLKLRLKARKRKNSARTGIKDRPQLIVLPLSASRIRIICRRPEDETRPSMHHHADAIELCWVLAREQPVSPVDCPNTVILTRCVSIQRLNAAWAGQRYWAFARWKNIRDDNKSSPWSQVRGTIVTN